MFVGDAHLAAVEALLAEWELVRRERRARLVLLEAETGWGKTRCVQELYARLAAGQPGVPYWPPRIADDAGPVSPAAIRQRRKAVRPSDFDPPPDSSPGYLWLGHDIDAGDGARADMALADLMDQIAAPLERDLRLHQAGREGVRLAFRVVTAMAMVPDPVAAAAGARDLADSFRRIRRLSGGGVAVGVESQHESQLAACEALLNRVWGRRGRQAPPAVVVLEDAHEARTLTLQLCRWLLARPEDSALPFLVVACAQPAASQTEVGDPGAGGPGARRRGSRVRHLAEDLPARCRILELPQLGRDDLACIAGGPAGDEVPPHLAAALAERADGNPYHLQLLALLCRQRYGDGLAGLDREAVLALPAQIADLLEALWADLGPAERQALAALALLGARSERHADAILAAHQQLPLDIRPSLGRAVGSGWVREQPDLLRFLELARWEIAHHRVAEYLDDAAQRDLVCVALDVVRDQRRGVAASPLLDEMVTHLADEALRLGCGVDALAVGREVLAWARRLRRDQDFTDADRAAGVAEGLAERALRRRADRDAADDLLVDVLQMRCALARLVHGRCTAPSLEAAARLEEQARSVGDRRPDLLVQGLLEVQRALRMPDFDQHLRRSRALLEEAAEVRRSRLPHDDDAALRVRSASYPWLHRDGDSRAAADEALACAEEYERRGGLDDRNALANRSDEAFYAMRFDVARSASIRREVLRRRESIAGDRSHPWVALAVKELAASLARVGDLSSAREACGLADEALHVAEMHFGPVHMRTLNALGVACLARLEAAELHEVAGGTGAARELRAQALTMAERSLASRRAQFPGRTSWKARQRYGTALEATGDDAGLRILREVLDERLQRDGAEHRPLDADTGWLADDLARALRRRGRDAEAQDVLREVARRRASS